MRVKNKKTGQVGDLFYIKDRDIYLVLKEPCQVLGCYKTVKEVENKWEEDKCSAEGK